MAIRSSFTGSWVSPDGRVWGSNLKKRPTGRHNVGKIYEILLKSAEWQLCCRPRS
jgi:hypothetical protein